ncbi:MAG: class I SAM-dependent methyltransferase [Bacillota bacterium]
MNFELLKKPQLFEPGDENIWTDPYISQRMVEAHLNTDHDAASRKASTIRKTVEWIDSMLPRNAKILDLGCGPGLYAEQFAELGHHVMGIDMNPYSIDYALENAKKKDLKIKYINESYFEVTLDEQFDAVIMIYCDMGTHSNENRDRLLRQIKKYLKPNGKLIFDVFNEKLIEDKKENRSWEYFNEAGFWTDEPHLVLSETLHYKESSLFCYQYVVITQNTQKLYRVWEHYYRENEIIQLLYNHGYEKVKIEMGLISKNDFTSNNVMFVVCEQYDNSTVEDGNIISLP